MALDWEDIMNTELMDALLRDLGESPHSLLPRANDRESLQSYQDQLSHELA